MAKNNRKPTLSICIPTFNREAALGRLLQNISYETAGLAGKVQVCISDNASPDGTGRMVRKWKGLDISYRKNKQNLGFDINSVQAISLAKGEFVWFMGDDDIIGKGAIKRVLEDINKADLQGIDCIFINAATKRGPMADFGFDEFRIFSVGKEYAEPNISFGGCLCFRTKTAKEIIRAKTKIGGKILIKRENDPNLLDAFVHDYLFLECLSRTRRIGIEPHPCIYVVADGNPQSYVEKIFRDIILMMFPLEINRHYPWFYERGLNYPFRAYLYRAGMVAQKPELEELYALSTSLYVKLLEKGGNGKRLMAVSAIESARKNPVGRFFLSQMLRVAVAAGLKVNPDKKSEALVPETLELAKKRAKMFAE